MFYLCHRCILDLECRRNQRQGSEFFLGKIIFYEVVSPLNFLPMAFLLCNAE